MARYIDGIIDLCSYSKNSSDSNDWTYNPNNTNDEDNDEGDEDEDNGEDGVDENVNDNDE